MLLDIASHITKQYPTKCMQRVKVMLKYNDNVITYQSEKYFILLSNQMLSFSGA